ncbi:MAG: hypothetical protein ETSY1_19210 [Candidatus Entotheonella factor]|uniref:Porin domain-containing protein n=1 Tax=Entotheonella factor TaxID=1429438 RepID=W4LK22_ENTF1|nr:hypothetical protein [Candidatus Entotheonella palauensis]ETW98302.1 MAG: hypothetical protein ETSY1_19210 [Candidatus Entotheonella factor]
MRRLPVVSIVVVGLVLMTFGFAFAQVQPGQKNVSLELSGQLNRGLLIANDGDETDFFNVDNDNSSTRFRLVGKYKGNNGFSVGTRIEVQVESNSTADVNQNNKRDGDGDFFGLRKAEIWFDTPVGRLSVGQGSTASDLTAEIDLSNTWLVAYSGVADLAGGILFFNDMTETLTDIAVGSVFANFDGLGRDDRLGYDSPTFAGFKLSTSWVTDDHWDVALRYAGEFGGIKVASAVSYAKREPAFDSQVSGSISALHTSGVNATFASGFRDIDDSEQEPYYVYFKLGYTSKFFPAGQSSFSIDYYYGEEIGLIEDESQSIGFAFVQNIDAFATELYIGLRNYDLDRDDASLDLNNVFGVLTGARVKF